MDSVKIVSDAINLLTSLGMHISTEPSSMREVAEIVATFDLMSIGLHDKAAELMKVLKLCQDIISHLIYQEPCENSSKNHSHQIEKLQMQNKKLRQMLQLHQKSFFASLLNTSSCSHCPKSFIDETHLEAHFQRRHEQGITESESFPLLDRINEYRGLTKVKNEQLDQLKVQMEELKSKLEEAENEIKIEREARAQLEQTISTQLDQKVDQIEKKLFHLPSDESSSSSPLQHSTGHESFIWAQIAVLKQLASEVASLKENISHTQSTQIQPISLSSKSSKSNTSYQQVESIVKQRLDELNIESDSTGISETCLETALKHIQEKRLANEVLKEKMDEQIAASNIQEHSRPIPTARTSLGPTGILKKSKSSDLQVDKEKESSKEQKKIQWSS